MAEITLLRVPKVVAEEYAVMDGDECVGRIMHSFGSGQLEWLWVIAISSHGVTGDHGRSASRGGCELAFVAAWPVIVALVPKLDRDARRRLRAQ